MRRRRANIWPPIIVGTIVLCFVFGLVKLFSNSSLNDPEDVVEAFYHYEQKGDFGSAWELLHPVMQERFSKNSFIQDRSQLYMSLEADTFAVELSEVEKVQNWTMAKEEYSEVYHIEVKQTLNSKFGTITIQQDSFVVENEGQWRLVWDYR